MYNKKERRLLRRLPYVEYRAGSLSDLNPLYKKFSGKELIFRGETRRKDNKNDTGLHTSLEKQFEAFKIRSKKEKQKWEKHLILRFHRISNLYNIRNVPALDDKLEWLALMQHYGAPTRLLDCTYSFYISCYFALCRLICGEEIGVVWAFDANWFSQEEKIEKIIGINEDEKKEQFNKIYKNLKNLIGMNYMDDERIRQNATVCLLMERKVSIPLVYNVTPFRMNERLKIQKGTFLFPGHIGISFEENLCRPTEYINKSKKNLHKITIKVQIAEKNRILKELDAMNINQAVLFPGLQGFAESLQTEFAFSERRNPK